MSAGASRRGAGYAMVAGAAAGWGTWPLILRNAPMPATLQSAIVITAVTLAPIPLLLRDRLAVKARLVDWLGIGWLGVSNALNIVLFFEAYQRTSVAIAVLTHSMTPIFVALAAPFVTRERPGAATLVAVGGSFGGLVMLLEPWREGIARGDLVGAALGAVSAAFYASNLLVTKVLTPVFSGAEMMVFHGVVGVPLLFAFVPPADYAAVDPHALLVVVLGSLGPGAAGALLFVWGVRRIVASHASVLTLLEPLVAVVLAATVMGERLGLVPALGGILILAAAALVIATGADAEDENRVR